VAEKTAEAKLSSGRDRILQSLAHGRGVRPPKYDLNLPAWSGDVIASFIPKAKASAAYVHEIAALADAPRLITEILRRAGNAFEIHIPAVSPLKSLPWASVPELTVSTQPPNGNESALSCAEFGIAETGTLVFLSGARSPSAWHFLPGREFVLIEKSRIVPRFEDVISGIGEMPATVNLITGPSRTADIEQTIEMGAHGPREVHILIAG
jgi:L-lactate dehydrogenase complex protein LldG